MNFNELQRHIHELALLNESDEPVVSCYVNPECKYRKSFGDQVRSLKKSVAPGMLPAFWEALGKIEVFLGTGIRSGTRGAAVFSRGGDRSFFLAMQFGAPLPNRVTIGPAPQIYPLCELKDNYYRYVVLLSSEESASILELNVGTITETVRILRPELRQRAGREWTKEHYRSHSQARLQQFINEQIHSLEQVISSGDYRHLVLAGDPRAVAQIQKALPKRLSAMVVGTVRASEKDKTPELVSRTLEVFEEHEEMESLHIVSRLGQEIGTHGAAVQGTSASIKALKNSQASILVLSQAYEPGLGSYCRACGELLAESSPDRCTGCGRCIFRTADIKEEIVRLAERNRCRIEIVKSCDAMSTFGGVGCLLRYPAPPEELAPMAPPEPVRGKKPEQWIYRMQTSGLGSAR